MAFLPVTNVLIEEGCRQRAKIKMPRKTIRVQRSITFSGCSATKVIAWRSNNTCIFRWILNLKFGITFATLL